MWVRLAEGTGYRVRRAHLESYGSYRSECDGNGAARAIRKGGTSGGRADADPRAVRAACERRAVGNGGGEAGEGGFHLQLCNEETRTLQRFRFNGRHCL